MIGYKFYPFIFLTMFKNAIFIKSAVFFLSCFIIMGEWAHADEIAESGFFEKDSVERKNLFDANFSELKLSDNRIYISAPKKRERLNKLDLNRDYFKGIFSNIEYTATSPSRWDHSDWIMAGSVAVGTGFFIGLDEEIRDVFENNRSSATDDIANLFKEIKPFPKEYNPQYKPNLSEEALITVMDELAYGAVAAMDEAGLDAVLMAEVLRVMMDSAVGSLDQIGASDPGPMLQAYLLGAVYGLSDIGVEPDVLMTVIDDLTFGALEGLADLDLANETEKVDILVELTFGLIYGLGDFDDLEDSHIAGLLNVILFAAISGLDDGGFDSEDALDMQLGAVENIVHSSVIVLDEAGYSAEQIGVLVDDLLRGAMSGMDSADIEDEDFAAVFEITLAAGISALPETSLADDQAMALVDELFFGAACGLSDLGRSEAQADIIASNLDDGSLTTLLAERDINYDLDFPTLFDEAIDLCY